MKSAMEERNPLFSVVVPTYSRSGGLSACLEALTRLDYPRERFEVIVVDDGGETSLEAVVERFAHRFDIKLVRQSHAGPAAARNLGAARSTGGFLVFTDDDCMPAPNWLGELERRFAAAPDHAIGGRTLNALSGNACARASQIILEAVYSYYNGTSGRPRFLASSNLAVPADRFRAIGGFDASFSTAGGEDRELCDRWLYHGYPMAYAPEAVIYHAHPLTFLGFCRQHFNYGRGALRFSRARVRRGFSRLRPRLGFYFRLAHAALSQGPGAGMLGLIGLLLVSRAATALGFVWEWLGDKKARHASA